MTDYLSADEAFGVAPISRPTVGPDTPKKKKVAEAAWFEDDPEFNALPQSERYKAQQLLDSGKVFHVLKGKVLEGEYQGPDQTKFLSADEAFGVKPSEAPKAPAAKVEDEVSQQSVGSDFQQWLKKTVGSPYPATALAADAYDSVAEPISKVLDRSWEKISNRVLSGLGVIGPESPNYDPMPYGPFSGTPGVSTDQSSEAAIQAAHDRNIRHQTEDQPNARKFGEWGSTTDLILNDSLPKHELQIMQGMTEQDWQGILKARNIASQLKIISNPDKYPEVAVQSAQAEIDKRLKKENAPWTQQWSDLFKAFKDDPASVGVELAASLRADPELLAAPQGLGLKVVSAGRIAKMSEGAANIAGRANRVADAITVGGGLNAQITLADQIASGRDVDPKEITSSFAMGAALSSTMALFMRAGAHQQKLDHAIETGSDLEKVFDDGMAEDLAKRNNLIEDLLDAPSEVYSPEGQKLTKTEAEKLRETLGINKLDAAGKKKFLAGRTAFLRNLSDPQRSSYFKAKAAERLDRSRKLSAGEAERAKRVPAEAAQQQAVARSLDETQLARVARVNEEVAAAEQAHAEAPSEATEARLDDAIEDANVEEVITGASQGEAQTQAAMETAIGRDAKRVVPRYEKGAIDRELVARLGVGSIFAGTAYALDQNPDSKSAAAFAAGLAALVVPGGGNLLRRLKQSGAIAGDGHLIGAIVKAGEVIFPKLSPEEEAAYLSHQKVRSSRSEPTQEEIDLGLVVEKEPGKAAIHDAALVEKSKAGNMDAFNTLYKDYSKRLLRWINRTGLKGADAEDALQNSFIYIHENLAAFDPTKGSFSTWAHKIAETQAHMSHRAAKRLKRGGAYRVESMHSKDVDATGEHQVGRGNVTSEVEEVSADVDTPEEVALQQDAQEKLAYAINKLPPEYKKVFIAARVEGLSGAEAAEMLGVNTNTYRWRLNQADTMVKDSLAKGLGAEKLKASGPKGQKGAVDTDLLKKSVALTGLAALGYGLSGEGEDEEGNPGNGKIVGALTAAGVGAAVMLTRGRKGSLAAQVTKGISKGLEPISSRIRKISEPLLHHLQNHEMTVLKTVHENFTKVAPFLQKMDELRYGKNPVARRINKLTGRVSEGAKILERAILTGRPIVTDRVLKALNDPELTAAWKETRKVLDSTGDKLVALGRFKPGALEYFPRIVKNLEGLRKALGTKHASFLDKALADAEKKMLRKTKGNRGLTEIERSLVINKVLREQEWNSHLPGYAKDRVINVIPKELLEFYHTPSESLHTYIRSAVKDIERAKFFGQELKTSLSKGKEYTNIDESIGAYVDKLVLKDKKITQEQHDELIDVLKSRFGNGEKAPAEFNQMVANISYATLLGNPLSAAAQLGDIVISTFTQGLTPTLDGLIRTVSGNKRISVRDLGLADHLAEEFADSLKSARFVNKIFKASLFTGADLFGKNVVLNAAVSKFARMARTEAGQAKIHTQFGRRLGTKEVDQFITDLNKGEMTDLVQTMAFTELSRTQPISKLELPQMHLDHPNGRLLYQYKTFMIKQLDLLNQEGLQKIKQGKYYEGAKGLLGGATILGLAGASTLYIQKYIKNLYLSASGHETDNIELKASDIPLNMLKTFGLSQYVLDHAFGVTKEEAEANREAGEGGTRTLRAGPAETLMDMVVPSAPADMFDTIVRHDKTALQKLPLIGWIYKLEQDAQKKENQ